MATKHSLLGSSQLCKAHYHCPCNLFCMYAAPYTFQVHLFEDATAPVSCHILCQILKDPMGQKGKVLHNGVIPHVCTWHPHAPCQAKALQAQGSADHCLQAAVQAAKGHIIQPQPCLPYRTAHRRDDSVEHDA